MDEIQDTEYPKSPIINDRKSNYQIIFTAKSLKGRNPEDQISKKLKIENISKSIWPNHCNAEYSKTFNKKWPKIENAELPKSIYIFGKF